jgi:hypothetical protein
MAKVSEHHGKEEGEGGDGVNSRVDLSVASHAICLNDALERCGARRNTGGG